MEHSIGRGHTGRSRARTGARAQNTAHEKREIPFFSPFARPFFAEQPLAALCYTLPFEIERRGETRTREEARKANESEQTRAYSFHAFHIRDEEDPFSFLEKKEEERGVPEVQV